MLGELESDELWTEILARPRDGELQFGVQRKVQAVSRYDEVLARLEAELEAIRQTEEMLRNLWNLLIKLYLIALWWQELRNFAAYLRLDDLYKFIFENDHGLWTWVINTEKYF